MVTASSESPAGAIGSAWPHRFVTGRHEPFASPFESNQEILHGYRAL